MRSFLKCVVLYCSVFYRPLFALLTIQQQRCRWDTSYTLSKHLQLNNLFVNRDKKVHVWPLLSSMVSMSTFHRVAPVLRVTNSYSIDPILSELTNRNEIKISSLQVANENVNSTNSEQSTCRSTIMRTSEGISVWRRTLVKGRVPIDTDFEVDGIWPSNKYIYENLVKAMNTIELPQFVRRHPETVNSVLITIIQLIAKLHEKQQSIVTSNLEITENDNENELSDRTLISVHEDDVFTQQNELFDMDECASDIILNGFINKWGNAVQGVKALDLLFGISHGLLHAGVSTSNCSEGSGFGLDDGVWHHTGWKVIPALQKQISAMPELRDLMKSIGRRSTSEKSNSFNKFIPQNAEKDGSLSAYNDPSMRTSVGGLTLSSSITDMLPSEAVLLRGSSPALRRLFLAKKAESKLISYQMSGWTDIPSVPRRRKHPVSTPAGPGGPLILCLDTSWSMSGARETLSKAVTLACISAAHKQKRDCHVVAFSNSMGVMETGKISPDSDGIRRLLDFLSYSFIGGGTDVTGALKHAMDMIESESMSAADLLLVSDGEIPDPPVPQHTKSALDRLRKSTGVQIYGLLVGKKESKSLSKLCSHLYDFLSGYEMQLLQTAAIDSQHRYYSENSVLRSLQQNAAKSVTSLKASVFSAGGVRDFGRPCVLRKESSNCRSARSRYLVHVGRRKIEMWRFALKSKTSSTDYKNYRENPLRPHKSSCKVPRVRTSVISLRVKSFINSDEDQAATFSDVLEKTVKRLQADVVALLEKKVWIRETLDSEKLLVGSCASYRNDLKAAIDTVREGLIERDVEAKLVVLGVVSQEHVLLLGPPGTAKSELGRRLSKLCGGLFFQRLLTKFTTPEEIFGPLSLRALENDEYRRCTEGFLPNASIAFLDEIFKANSAILNTLLTILNERKYDNGVGQRMSCPIRCVVGASNELPESEDLDALYDRFLLRKEVKPVSDDGIMQLLCSPTTVSRDGQLRTNEVKELSFPDVLENVIVAVNGAADAVSIELDVCSLIRDLRSFMRDEFDVSISDRRLVKAARLLKIIAATNGRSSVDTLDCLILEHVTWQHPEQQQAVRDWLWEHLTPGGESPVVVVEPFRLILNGLSSEAVAAVRKTSGDISGAFGARDSDIALIQAIEKEIGSISDILQDRLTILSRHAEIVRQSTDHIWLTPDESIAVNQHHLPRVEVISKEIYRILAGAMCLRKCLTDENIDSALRLSVIECLCDETFSPTVNFTEDELNIGMKEAKARYDADTFRAWKRARKKIKVGPN